MPIFGQSIPPLLVGRDREQHVLRDRLVAVVAGRGSLVLIGGEAGIGKTTLAASLGADAENVGALVLMGRCFDLAETPPYGPWRDLFSDASARDLPTAPPPALADTWADAAIGSQLGLFEQVEGCLSAASEIQPLVVLLDDLQWADPASLELLRYLARSLAHTSLLIVATYRADELTRHHALYPLIPLLVREASAVRFDLRPLHREDVRTLIAARYPLNDQDTVRLATDIHDRSEGNPFFVSELLRTIEEGDLIRSADDGWTLGDLRRVRIPAVLQQVIDGRLARLSDETQHLLVVAAIIGQEVPMTLLTAVAEMGDEQAYRLVEPAIEAHMLDELPEGGVRFVHALIREALYARTLLSRRRTWHRRVGEVVARQPSPDPDIVAYHFKQAGDARAAQWLIDAGVRAQHTHAWLAAADRYEGALAVLDASGANASERGWLHYRLAVLRRFSGNPQGLAHLEEAATLAAEVNDVVLTAHVQYYQGHLRCIAGDLRRGLPMVQAAVTAFEALPPVDGEWRSGLDIIDATTARGASVVLSSLIAPFPEGRALAERFIGEASARTDTDAGRAAYGDAYHGLGMVHAHEGRPEAALAMLTRAHEVFRAIDFHHMDGLALNDALQVLLTYETEQLSERRRLAAMAERAFKRAVGMHSDIPEGFGPLPLLVIEGEWEQARSVVAAMKGCAAIFRAIADPFLAPLVRAQGDTALAWSMIWEWLPDGPDTASGSVMHYVSGLGRVAALLATDAGEWDAARRWLDAYDRWLLWSGSVLGRAERALAWAHYRRAMGDLAAACRHANDALNAAIAPRQPLALIAANRLLGELATEADRRDDAQQHLDIALALADACAAPYERALTLIALAHFRLHVGDTAHATQPLAEARSILTRLDAKPALARLDALAGRCAGAAPSLARDPPGPTGLTAREGEILQLLAVGRSNSEIADLLSLSVRTVERHITNLYGKIDARSRADAVGYAFRRGLA